MGSQRLWLFIVWAFNQCILQGHVNAELFCVYDEKLYNNVFYITFWGPTALYSFQISPAPNTPILIYEGLNNT